MFWSSANVIPFRCTLASAESVGAARHRPPIKRGLPEQHPLGSMTNHENPFSSGISHYNVWLPEGIELGQNFMVIQHEGT